MKSVGVQSSSWAFLHEAPVCTEKSNYNCVVTWGSLSFLYFSGSSSLKFGLSEKHTKFEKIFIMVLTNQLIYLVKVKTMKNIFSNSVCFSKSLNFNPHHEHFCMKQYELIRITTILLFHGVFCTFLEVLHHFFYSTNV